MIPDESFGKKDRLIKTKYFRQVYKKGVSVKRNGFVFYCLTNGTGKNKIGFSIPSRVARLATRRNRLKRVLREVYRKNKNILAKGFDIVLAARKYPKEPILYGEIEDLFRRLVKEAGILA